MISDVITLLFLGLSVGIVSSFLGIGGGVLIIPTTLYLFKDLTIQQVIPISLGVIALNSAINSYNFYKHKALPSKNILIPMIIACCLSAPVFSYFTEFIDSKKLEVGFLILISVIALRTLYSITINAPKVNELKNSSPWTYFSIGLFGAAISSLTGLGGGSIFIPLLMTFTSLPMKQISPISNAAMFFTTVLGVIPQLIKPLPPSLHSTWYADYFIGNVNILIIVCIFSISSISSRFGVKLNNYVSEKTKKLVFASLLVLIVISKLIK